MSTLLTSIPYFNRDMHVEAYWISTHDSDRMFGVDNFLHLDNSFSHPGLEIIDQVGVEPFAGDKRLFVPVTKMQLIAGLVSSSRVRPNEVTCIIKPECLEDQNAREALSKLKRAGATVALDGMPEEFTVKATKLVDFIIIDLGMPDYSDELYEARKCGKKLIYSGVDSAELFERCKRDKSVYFTGKFYTSLPKNAIGKLSPIKVNALRLMKAVNKEDFEPTDIIPIIEHDPFLSVSILRFLNRVSSGLARRIESLPQAVTILGQNAIRRWANISVSSALGSDRPNELSRLSLIRAKFAEDIAAYCGLQEHKGELFLAGLFSLLDVMLEQPMDQAIREVPVSDAVKEALVNHTGILVPAIAMVSAYGMGDWNRVSMLAIQNGVELEKVQKAYVDALVWYREMLDELQE